MSDTSEEIIPFNHGHDAIMPESDDKTLCILIDRPISVADYKNIFLPRLAQMLEKYGEARVLIYFKDYQGWEEKAVELDLKTVLRTGHKLKKLALVNFPRQEIKSLIVKRPLLDGEEGVHLFQKEALDDAIKWVKS